MLSKKREGRITASVVGAILGHNPYKSSDDVMRDMVRVYHGLEVEFKGNAATRYGQDNEQTAIDDYELDTGFDVVRDPGFVIHPEFNFLGCTPDGLIGEKGLVEIKSPFSKKTYTLMEKQFYHDQVCLQILCTGVDWCDFYCWTPEEQHKERVCREEAENWWGEHKYVITDFYHKYLSIREDAKLSAPYLADLEVDMSEDDKWFISSEKYKQLKTDFELAKELLEEAKHNLLLVAKEQGAKCVGNGVMAYKATRKGNVNYKKVPELDGVDLEQYRNKDSEYWVVK